MLLVWYLSTHTGDVPASTTWLLFLLQWRKYIINRWPLCSVPPASGLCDPRWPGTQPEWGHSPFRVPFTCPAPLLTEVSISSLDPAGHWPILAFLESSLLICRLKAAMPSPWVQLLGSSRTWVSQLQCDVRQTMWTQSVLAGGVVHWVLQEATWSTYARHKSSCWEEQATGSHLGPFLLTGQQLWCTIKGSMWGIRPPYFLHIP